MTEAVFRARICTEAETWIGTPYSNAGRIKQVGVNCAQLLYGVAMAVQAIPQDSPEPRWFTPQFAAHTKEERLADYIRAYGGVEIPVEQAASGDIYLSRSGQAHGHAAIIIRWPDRIIHCLPRMGCQAGHAYEGAAGILHKQFFTLWKGIS